MPRLSDAERRRFLEEWDRAPPPDPRLQQRVQDEFDACSILANPDHPGTRAWNKVQAEHDARYYADADDDAPDRPLTAEEVAAADWNPQPSPKTAADRARREAVLDAMDAHARRKKPAG